MFGDTLAYETERGDDVLALQNVQEPRRTLRIRSVVERKCNDAAG
jgi:hypothetical protein